MNKQEEKDFREKLEKIIEKRNRYESLTSEEETFLTKALDNMLDSKKVVRKSWGTSTGDEVRKAGEAPALKKPKSTKPSFEDGNPKNRGFEGGYDSKADVDERETASPDAKQPPKQITQDARHKTDNKEEKVPTEDNSGEVKAEYSDEDYNNTDEKENDSQYEEDRVGRYLKMRDVVIKPVKKGMVQVGQVLKVYPARERDQYAVLVKWSDGRFSHENSRELKLVEKSEGSKSPKSKKEEDEKVTPPVKKAEKVGKQEEAPKEEAPSDEPKMEQPPQEWLGNCASVLAEEEPNLSEEDRIALCAETWRIIISGEMPEEEMPPVSQKTAKGDKPPSEWLDNCVASLERDNADVDNAYAVCTATYNKMKSANAEDLTKDAEGNFIVKITPEDMDKYCPPCGEKMRNKKMKYYKMTVSASDLAKYSDKSNDKKEKTQ